MVDPSQDYELLGGFQNDTHTVIRFSRAWDTCDEQGVKTYILIMALCTQVLYVKFSLP